jgi:hypothetical protein
VVLLVLGSVRVYFVVLVIGSIKVCSSNYSDFLKRHLHQRNRLLDPGYKKIRLIRSLTKFIFRYQYLVEIYSVSAETIINYAFSYSENV